MTDGAAPSGPELSYAVEVRLPAAALGVRHELSEAVHRADRRVGVIVGNWGAGLLLRILRGASTPEGARDHAVRLVVEALELVGVTELTPHLEVGEITSRPKLAGRVRYASAAPALGYRSTALPDGRVLRAASAGVLGEWFAFLEDRPGRVVAGRDIKAVLRELFEVQWREEVPWFPRALAELTGHPAGPGARHPCPCCDHLTLEDRPPGTFAICQVCWWEDDGVQFSDPDYRGGANRMSLREARESFVRHGSKDPARRLPVRAPRPDEMREG